MRDTDPNFEIFSIISTSVQKTDFTKSIPLISPLRYPGSKRKQYKFVRQFLISNNLRPNLYVEPFAGGASVALQLLQDNQVDSIGLIDLDPLVIAFWQTVFFDSEWLIDQIEKVEVSLENWRKFKTMRSKSTRGMALTCLFLNRTSFSGILSDSAGPIGGISQESDYLIDCRFPKETIIKRIQQIASHRERVAFIWCGSWKEGMRNLRKIEKMGGLPTNKFFYIDPPFFEKADRLYRYYFKMGDHIELRDFLLTFSSPWLLSYDEPNLAKNLYGDSVFSKGVSTIYSASSDSGFKNVKEILISNLPIDTKVLKNKTKPSKRMMEAACRT